MKKGELYRGKNIWIIGASDGIGKALAVALHQLGANLILSSRSREKLEELQRSFQAETVIVPLDVTSINDFHTAATFVLGLKKIDYIIYLPGFYEPMPLKSLTNEIIDMTIAVNLRSVFTLLQSTLDYLKKNPECQLAVFASCAGYIGLPNAQPYAATKAAVINLLESFKAEHPTLNVKLINPGFVKTRLTDKNKFYMPALISAQQAANAVLEGLLKNKFEIHFPKRLTWAIKLLKLVPYKWYFFFLNR